MDGRHVRRNARIPDQRRLPGPAREAHRRAGREDHGHPGGVPLLRHDLDVADADDRRRRSLGGDRRGAGLRALDLLPADHRRGTHHEDVGAGLRPADDGRRVDDAEGQHLVRRGAHGAHGVARNRCQSPADHLLLPRGDGRLLDQRRHRLLPGKTDERLRPAHGGAGRGGPAGRGVELLAPVVHGQTLERDHPRRLGTRNDGRNLGGRPRTRLRYGVELRQGGDLQPADPRFHGPRIGHDFPGGRRDGRRAERIRTARRGAAAARLLGHAALHGRSDLPRSGGGVPRGAGHRAGPGAQQVVDRRRMRRDDPAGLGPQPDGIHRIRLQIPPRLQQVPHGVDDARRRPMGRAAAGRAGPDAALEGGDPAGTADEGTGLGRGRHGRTVPAVRHSRRSPLRLRTRGERRDDDRHVPPHLREQRHAVVHRPRPGCRVGRSDGRRHERRPRGDDAGRRMAFAADDSAGGGRRGAVRPAEDRQIRADGAAGGRDAAGPRAGGPAVPRARQIRIGTPPAGGAHGGRQGDHAGQRSGLPGAEPHGESVQRRHDQLFPPLGRRVSRRQAGPLSGFDRPLSVERR